MTLTVGSLFSGIGGLELGLERAGMEVKWQCEIDPFCLKVLEKHWPNVQRFTDIKTLTEVPYVDLICGGFPCQPVSCAGKRKGSEDSRWLWPEFYRIIKIGKPKYVLIENVRGLLSAEKGRLFKGILQDLAESGYNAEWRILRASDVGAPHQRARVFLVAYTKSRGFVSDSVESRIFGPGANKISDWWGGCELVRGNRGRVRKVPDGGFCRMDNGLPKSMDRIKALGNAVVPQCSEYIGKCIINFNAKIGGH